MLVSFRKAASEENSEFSQMWLLAMVALGIEEKNTEGSLKKKKKSTVL